MDTLRLLTRSSKQSFKPAFTWGANAAKNASPAHDSGTTATHSLRGAKRKRSEQRNPTADDVPNFFGEVANSNHEISVMSKTVDEIGQAVQVNDVIPEVEASLDESACRAFMKQHKLKVTVLEGDPTKLLSDGAGQSKARRAQGTLKETKTPPKDCQLWPQPVQHFSVLAARYDISRRLAQNLVNEGYASATEVQSVAIPLLMDAVGSGSGSQYSSSFSDGLDLLSVAPTGSGKTLAFLLPLIHDLSTTRRSQGAKSNGTTAVILAPTKELAHQITNEGRKLAANTGIKFTCVKKGMKLERPNLSESPDDPIIPAVKSDVLVSTPLTLLHAIQESSTPLALIRHLVLDEADVLLDPLFRDQTLSVWTAMTNPALRTTLWSATMGSSIETQVQTILSTRHMTLWPTLPRAPLLRLVVGLKDSAIPNIDHRLTYCATEQGKLMALRQLLHPTGSSTSTSTPVRAPFLVFVQTIDRATALHAELRYDIPLEAGGSSRIQVLHSKLSDSTRDAIMTKFRKGEVWVLITTDLLSRGVDFAGVNAVVNYDVPSSSAAYVHRVGRTGRHGRGGVAVTLYSKEDVGVVKSVVNVIAASQKATSGTGKAVQNGAETATAAAVSRTAPGAEETQGVQQWLLDALPKVSKRDKKMLKQRGVEARRTAGAHEGKTKGRGAARISTRTSYDRRKEHNLKAAKARHREHDLDRESSAESEFGGFED